MCLKNGLVFDSIMRQTVYQNGGYREGLVSGWLKDINEENYINTILLNEEFNYEYWEWISAEYNNQWNAFNLPIVHLAGFYDIFSTNQILTALTINSSAKYVNYFRLIFKYIVVCFIVVQILKDSKY